MNLIVTTATVVPFNSDIITRETMMNMITLMRLLLTNNHINIIVQSGRHAALNIRNRSNRNIKIESTNHNNNHIEQL